MTEVVNVPDLDLQFFGNDGKPMASGHVVFFRNGTDIPESVYTSDGETTLGNTIELDASGFPVVQFSLIADKKYTVKLFDSDNVLVWTRNDIQGTICGGPGPIGDFIPMDGTTQADPVRGPLVWNDENGKATVKSGQMRVDNSSNEFTNIYPASVTLYGPNSQASLWKDELRLFSSWTGQEGTARLRTSYLQYSNQDGSQNSYVNPNSIELTNTNGSGALITSLRQPGEAINSSRLELTCGANRLRLKSCEDGSGDWIQSNETLRVESNGHLYCDGKYVHIGSNGSTGLMDTAISSEHGDVRITTDNKNLTLHNTSFDFGQGTGIYADKIIQASSVTPGSPDDHGLITEAAAVALLGGGGMTNPMTDEGDMIVGGVGGAPSRLANGLQGQLLTMGVSGPEWSDKPAACQENYSIIDSTGIYAADSYINQILTSKVIANVDRTYSQLGFGLKKGQTGGTGRFMLAIYDVSKNLVASTPIFQITETYQGEVYWVDTEATFKLNAGNEYFFAFWTEEYPGSNTIQFLGHQQVSTFDADLVGILYGQSGLSEMPLSLGTLSYGQMCPYMAVR